MKVLVVSLVLCLVVGAFADDGEKDVDCEGFDTYALCPGGWPNVPADEARHRVKCCGNAEAGKCPLCNRCKIGTFEDGCCTCDDDELVNKFWQLMHMAHHNPNTQADNTGITEREFVDLVAECRGEMDAGEELKVKDVYSSVAMHVLGPNQKTTSGLIPYEPLITFLRESPDIVEHIIGEGESPSEGAYQLALDHTKAIIPEWFSGLNGEWGGHLPPPIMRKQNGMWMILVPNFAHPSEGYMPAVYRHSHQEAKAYIAEKKAEYLQQEAKQEELTHNIRAKAAENVDLVHHDRQDGKAGFKQYNDMTKADKDMNLTGEANKVGTYTPGGANTGHGEGDKGGFLSMRSKSHGHSGR